MSSTTPVPDSLTRIVQRFQWLSHTKQGYELLTWYAKRLKKFPEIDKVPENKVAGCASQVYLTATLGPGKIWFQGDSDSQLVKGLVALLVQGFNNLTPAKILNLSLDFIQDTGWNVSLTPFRANGFYNIKKMKKKVLNYPLIIFSNSEEINL